MNESVVTVDPEFELGGGLEETRIKRFAEQGLVVGGEVSGQFVELSDLSLSFKAFAGNIDGSDLFLSGFPC